MSNPSQPTLTVTDGVVRLTFPTDDYLLDFTNLARTKYGSLLANVTARHGIQTLHMARFDVLNQRDQEHFHQRCLSVNGTVADWQSRLQSAIPGLERLLTIEGDPNAGAVWDQAITVEDFLLQEDTQLQADAKDLVIPGCITLMAAPRASGKTLVALFLALALAQGGLFRGERVPQRRVLLVDRDNPPALIRKRLRWLGAQHVTGLKVLTRDQAPPLTNAAAWASFPADQYDVIVVDSIGAATEGVSEKEGKQTQQYLATLKDVARRGPAILALDNTNKAALNYRGRGEKGDAVDILYECRNITGWTPAQGGDWWEDLPDFGEHTWQQRASRRKGQQVLQIAFIPSKFRPGAEPEPFALEIDTRQAPWTLADITEDIATAGERAAQEARRQEQAKLDNASQALVTALREHQGHSPILKQEAEALLQGQGLSKRVARTLLEHGGNRDIYPEGWWVLRPIPGERGHPIGVFLPGEEDGGRNNLGQKSSTAHGVPAISISATRSTPSGRNTPSQKPAETLRQTDVLFRPPQGYEVAEIESDPDKHICGSQQGGIISATEMHSKEEDASCEEEPWPEPPEAPLTPEERFDEIEAMYERVAEEGPPPAVHAPALQEACPKCRCTHLRVVGAYRECSLCRWKGKL